MELKDSHISEKIRQRVNSMRREFEIFKDDARFLDARQYKWETIIDHANNKNCWVLIHDYPLPPGYNVTSATAAFLLSPANYLHSGIDMVYFNPPLNRSDGVMIRQTESSVVIEGSSYQRWSRHRQGDPWTPGNDSLVTHLSLVDYWLAREFQTSEVRS